VRRAFVPVASPFSRSRARFHPKRVAPYGEDAWILISAETIVRVVDRDDPLDLVAVRVLPTVAIRTRAEKKRPVFRLYQSLLLALDTDTRDLLGKDAALVNETAVSTVEPRIREWLGCGVELFAQSEVIKSRSFPDYVRRLQLRQGVVVRHPRR
jgi:hypothetical protein